MSPPVLFIRSDYPAAEGDHLCLTGRRGVFAQHIDKGILKVVWDWELTVEHLQQARGVLTTIHLDQIRIMTLASAFEAFLDRGGRLLLSAHVKRPFLAGLRLFQWVGGGRRVDFQLEPLANHPVFDGIDRSELQLTRGVAGFYGRGCNPMPEGATALTGVGPNCLPVDWVWQRPSGGVVLSHAGNDWWTVSGSKDIRGRFAENLVRWANHEVAA